MDKTDDLTKLHPLHDARKGDVQAAMEVCEYVLTHFKTERPLDKLSKEYIVEALQKILQGVSADTAMLLKRGKKGHPAAYWGVAYSYYSAVEKLHDAGMAYEKAYEKVAEQKNKSLHTVRSNHKTVKRLIRIADKEMDEWEKDEWAKYHLPKKRTG